MPAPVTTACLMAAAMAFSVPADVLIAIMAVEGGRVGEISENTNGSRDYGPMQTNSVHLADVAARWGLSPVEAEARLRDDGCFNVEVAAWHLSRMLKAEGGDLLEAIGRYHSATPRYKYPYQERVLAAYERIYGRPLSPDVVRIPAGADGRGEMPAPSGRVRLRPAY